MRQYRLNRESLLYMKGEDPRTLRGHRKSCLDEFETLPIPPPPAPQKNETATPFQGACRYFLQGILCRYFAEAFSLSIRRGERRFASCRVRKQSNVRHTTHIRGFSGTPAKPAFQISRLRRTCNSGFFRKNILTLRFKLTVRKLRYLAF